MFQAQGVTHENVATKGHGPAVQFKKFFGIGCIWTHFLFTGSSHISSKDAFVKPEINPHHFSSGIDRATSFVLPRADETL